MIKKVRLLLSMTLCVTLFSGCASGALTNRLTCGANGDAFYISTYGAIGVSSVIDKSDGAVICPKPVSVLK